MHFKQRGFGKALVADGRVESRDSHASCPHAGGVASGFTVQRDACNHRATTPGPANGAAPCPLRAARRVPPAHTLERVSMPDQAPINTYALSAGVRLLVSWRGGEP
eukprot:4365242-Pleurochrysis_carterae.AAC.3